MTLTPEDRQYLSLLSHLRQPNSNLPLETLRSALPYYLSRLPIEHVTTLTATVLASGYWLPVSVERTLTLGTVFEHSLLLRHKRIEEEKQNAIFSLSRSISSQLRSWIQAVLRGASSGNQLLRLYIYGGVISAIRYLEASDEDLKSLDSRSQDAFVYAAAELLDRETRHTFWKQEFKSTGDMSDTEIVATIAFAEYLGKVSAFRWSVIDLKSLLKVCLRALKYSFHSGTFLQKLPPRLGHGVYHVTIDSGAREEVQQIIKDPLFLRMSSLSKILARSMALLAESHTSALEDTMRFTLHQLDELSSFVEASYSEKQLESLVSDKEIATESQQVMTDSWLILKTLLFATLMISQSILNTLVYYPHASKPPPFTSDIARSVLRIIIQLSFVVSEIGGVASTSSVTELKKCFYTAVDCLAIDVDASDTLVTELCQEVSFRNARSDRRMGEAKLSVVLLLVEQLVPTLTESVLEEHVIPLCIPLLSDSRHRESYESAHSVMLSIFGAYAEKQSGHSSQSQISEPTSEFHKLEEKLVPFYCRTLLDNAEEGRLSTDQLRLAFSNLVRSARSGTRYRDELAWYCVNSLQQEIKNIDSSKDSLPSDTQSSSSAAPAPAAVKRRHRLCLTLISLVSAVPLRVLVPLTEILGRLIAEAPEETRTIFMGEIKQEIMERVGDAEKQFCLDWWGDLVGLQETTEATNHKSQATTTDVHEPAHL